MKITFLSILLAIIFLSVSTGVFAKDDAEDLLQQFFADRRTEIEKIADDPGAMREYVLSQKDVNARYKDGRTLLHFAANKGYDDVVTLLLEKGADVNAQDNDGRTPLHEAMSYGRIGVVRFLVDHGANVNLKNKDGETPLISVVFMDDKKLAINLTNLFLHRGFDITKSSDAGLLDETIRRGHRDIALILLNKGTKYDDAALFDAARMGYEDIFDILLLKGARPGQGIVRAACESGNLNIVKTLIGKGQQPTGKDIDFAVYEGHTDVAVYLNALLKKTTGQQVDIRKRCDLKPDQGSCKALFHRAYYDPAAKRCAGFVYGGCGGEVPFATVQACKNVCEENPEARSVAH